VKKKNTVIKKLEKARACSDGIDWLKEQKETDLKKLALKAIEENHTHWVNWAIVKIMTYKQYVSYAIYATKQVLDIYEKKYPNDKRLRDAIKAAEKCIKNPTRKNKDAAEAARAAALAAEATGAAWAVAKTAGAAWAAAETTAWAAEAAWAAAETAVEATEAMGSARAKEAVEAAAEAAGAAKKEMQIKIVKNGFKLLGW